AAATFRQGFAVARRHLGENHPLTVTLGSNCDAMASKWQGQPAGKRPGGGAALRPAPPALPSVPSALKPASAAAAAVGIIPYPQPALGSSSPALPALPSARGAVPAQEALDLPRRGQARQAPALAPSSDAELPSHNHDDVINADNTGHAVGRSSKASRDFRPHRMVAGSTRTAKLARRTLGGSVETAHRDKLVAAKQQDFKGLAAAKTAYRRKMAAERIQRSWRAYREYCEENSELMQATWNAASQIQAKWRSHRSHRDKRSAAAISIQRIVRGAQARERLRRDAAATMVQKLGRGSNARARMRLLRRSGLKITALVRGFLARRRVRRVRGRLTEAVLKIQRTWRGHSGRRQVWGLRAVHDEHQALEKAAVRLQRSFRGWKGRQRFQLTRQQYLQDVQQHYSAARIQSQVRRKAASRRVEGMKADRRRQMDDAATLLRKMWLGYRSRRRYRDLMRQFQQQEKHVVTVQRYARGFLVRNRMWREAVSAEEELWATLEIQRVWRGYLGRAQRGPRAVRARALRCLRASRRAATVPAEPQAAQDCARRVRAGPAPLPLGAAPAGAGPRRGRAAAVPAALPARRGGRGVHPARGARVQPAEGALAAGHGRAGHGDPGQRARVARAEAAAPGAGQGHHDPAGLPRVAQAPRRPPRGGRAVAGGAAGEGRRDPAAVPRLPGEPRGRPHPRAARRRGRGGRRLTPRRRARALAALPCGIWLPGRGGRCPGRGDGHAKLCLGGQ
ncbi:unnamed protein product, partial [Prorocentrum cordatum]